VNVIKSETRMNTNLRKAAEELLAYAAMILVIAGSLLWLWLK
jgi:hypothetical protein